MMKNPVKIYNNIFILKLINVIIAGILFFASLITVLFDK